MNRAIIGKVMVCCSVEIPTAIALGDSVNGLAWIVIVSSVGACALLGLIFMQERRG